MGILWDEQKRLDLSIRYDLENLTGYKASIFVDFNNLTDEPMSDLPRSWNPNQVKHTDVDMLLECAFPSSDDMGTRAALTGDGGAARSPIV